MRISDWSSDVCSSDLLGLHDHESRASHGRARRSVPPSGRRRLRLRRAAPALLRRVPVGHGPDGGILSADRAQRVPGACLGGGPPDRSEEHTSELQSLMRISYAVFCLKKKNISFLILYILFMHTFLF